MTTYTVQPGDTLQKISAKFYGTTDLYGLIQEANNITDPNRIYVGQVLIIPPAPSTDYTSYHRAFDNGVRWRLVTQGIEIEGSGIERTDGEPQTVTKIWNSFYQEINQWAKYYNVPCVAIIANIATESGGNANAIREEPGYISDITTPHKVSVGLMQTLISTARETLNNSSINRQFLLNPSNSIQAGTAYIHRQRYDTFVDPPKLAAAYNCGGVYENQSSNNRWRMLQYPQDTSHHCDRYVKWFNDAVYVLSRSSIAASVPYDEFYLGDKDNGNDNGDNNSGSSNSILKIVTNTLLKLEPKQSSDLEDWQKIKTVAGQEYEIVSSESILGNHLKITLAKPLNFGSESTNIIYVFADHVKVSGISEPTLNIIVNTILKLEPKESSDLTSGQKLNALAGEKYEIISAESILGNHLKITLVKPLNFGLQSTNIIYVFADHVKVSGIGEPTLNIIFDTILKLEPKESSNLASGQKLNASAGEEYKIISSESILGNHLKIKLVSPLNFASKSTDIIYVFADHVKVSGINDDSEEGMKIKVLYNTFFKDKPIQASDLTDSQKVVIAANTEYKLHSHIAAENNHVKIALADAKLGSQGKNTWYAFAPHIEIEGNEPGNNPNDKPDTDPPKTGAFKLPGFTSTFYLSDPIIPGGHFTWAEATKNGARIPVTKNIVEEILKIARSMEDVREFLGSRPIIVNSWYRDPKSNAAVGGASQSRHLVGDAVDFTVQGIAPYEVSRRLDAWWGGKGGLASSNSFTHIDQRGYKARWSYDYLYLDFRK